MGTLRTKKVNLELSLGVQEQCARSIETSPTYQSMERWPIYRRKNDSNNDEEEVDRKGKQIMKVSPQPSQKFKVPRAIKIIDLESSPE